MRRTAYLVATTSLICVSLTASAQTYRYAVVDLGILDGTSVSEAEAVNALGQVAGTSWQGGNYRAFRYTDGVGMENLGTLPSPFDWGSYGQAINSYGQVAGYSYRLEGTFLYPHAFRYTDGVGMEDLGTLGGDSSRALAMNDAGQVVGNSRIAPGDTTTRAFRYTDGVGMEDLGVLWEGSYTSANDINNAGQVVGQSGSGAFRFTDGVGIEHLGDLGGGGSIARAINDAGQVVGESQTDLTDEFGQPLVHAFLYTDGVGMQDLGVLPGNLHSFATAINDCGHVLGICLDEFYASTEFIWTPQGGMMPLAEMVDTGDEWGWPQFTDLNARGQVVGRATRWGHGLRAFRLEPILAADVDFDGDVDLRDFAMFSSCFGGAETPPSGACPAGVVADFDFDGDVDLADYAELRPDFAGPL